MQFCPTCGNLLAINRLNDAHQMQFSCNTCPYVYPLDSRVHDKTVLTRKKVDDVLGGEGAWDNVDSTDATCPKCSHDRAYFMQIQIRSADEPMSTFYKCCKCGAQWREG